MARTTAVLAPSFCVKLSMVLPAAIDKTTAPSAVNLRYAGNSASMTCGFTARTRTSGAESELNNAGLSITATPRRTAAAAFAAAGSTTHIDAAGTPWASQPSSIAEPMLPLPTRTIDAVVVGSVTEGSSFANGFDHRRGQRVAGGFASPDDILKRRVKALAVDQRVL